jgi:hypothetical protein
MSALPTKVAIKVDPKISIGLGTISGILFAVAQYLGAIGLMLAGDLTAESITAMATATLTLVTTIAGRFKQADSAIKAISSPPTTANPTVGSITDFAPSGPPAPESNVLYLDGNQIAAAIVKSLNTRALVAQMTQPEPAKTETEAASSGSTPIPGESS